ncbi:hypothetical protein ACFLYJ_02245 [Candidatus Cloacimonadota bacterium]
MKKFILGLLFVIICISGCMVNNSIRGRYEARVEAEEVDLNESDLSKRTSLKIPYHLWKEVADRTGYGDKKVGLTSDEMNHYVKTIYTLRYVDNLFRDVRRAPGKAGKLSSSIMKANGLSGIVEHSFRILGSYTRVSKTKNKDGEQVPITWDVDWIEDDTPIDEAMQIFIDHYQEEGITVFEDEIDHTNWKALSNPIKRFSIRIALAAIQAQQEMGRVYDLEFLKSTSFTEEGNLNYNNLYDFAISPFSSKKAPTTKSFEAFEKMDYDFLSYAMVKYTSELDLALDELQDSGDFTLTEPLFAKDINLTTPAGDIVIGYKEGETLLKPHAVFIELGGNTVYQELDVNEKPMTTPVTTHIDLGGDDIYHGPSAHACYSSSILIDVAGNDTYTAEDESMGCAYFGFALLADFAGNDIYEQTGLFSQGVGLAGVGLIVDYEGDDDYKAGAKSQGLGLTNGVGMMVDFKGNDSYWVNQDEPKSMSDAWGRSVSLSQGCGYGRRADFGDGHSLAGGVGGIIDGAGDDSYYAGIFAQGSGYWYGFGFLEDLSGNDTYRALAYSQGSGVHIAVGSLVDLQGNDKYNSLDETEGLPDYKRLGSNRDMSIGAFYDGSGNDQYVVGPLCAGFSDIAGVGLFWDRLGDDKYTIHLLRPGSKTPSMGAALLYGDADKKNEPKGSYLTTGIFLDTDGNDIYDGSQYIDQKEENGKLKADNNREWYHDMWTGNTGFGIDRNLFQIKKEQVDIKNK